MGQGVERGPRRPRSEATLSDHETKRREAVWELFHSEVIYLMSHLLVLKEVRIGWSPKNPPPPRRCLEYTSYYLNFKVTFCCTVWCEGSASITLYFLFYRNGASTEAMKRKWTCTILTQLTTFFLNHLGVLSLETVSSNPLALFIVQ